METVERVRSFKFLGIYLSDSLSWSTNTTAAIKKAQQRLHFLRVLKKNRLCQKLLVAFYRSAIESVLTCCLTVWYGGCSGADKKSLQRVIKNAQNIIGCPLPLLLDIANTRYLSRAKNIKDFSHPGHHLFSLLPSGRRYRSIKTRTARFSNSFYPRAIQSLN